MSRGDELIARYLDDTLSEEESLELQAWLQSDAANLQKLVIATARDEQLRAAVVSTETLSATTSRHAADAVTLSVIPPKNSKHAAIKWIVAACLLAVVAWFAAPRQNSEPTLTLIETSGQVSLADAGGRVSRLKAAESFATGTIVVNGEGSRAKFRYADGSTFSLAGGSELNLRSGDGKQMFLRHGTLLADVAPQPAGQPLVVHTATAEAVVLGTSFGINATESETWLQVSSGAVNIRRLADDQTTTVNMNERVLAGSTADQALRAEPITVLPFRWRADSVTGDAKTWLGEWSEPGILRATPQTVFLKETDVEETHFHAGIRHSYPGFVTLDANSVVRIRYRIDRPMNLGLFISTHAALWDFTGNFQARVEERFTPPDRDGWRTATVPVVSFFPMGERLSFQPGCVVSTIYATTWADNVRLEVAELEIRSTTGGK